MTENRFMNILKEEAKVAENKSLEESIKAEVAKEQERIAKLTKDIVPNKIEDTVADIKAGKMKAGIGANGERFGTEANGWTVKMCTVNNRNCLVMGATPEEAEQDKHYIAVQLYRGDVILPNCHGLLLSGRYVTKEIMIPGSPWCLTKGHTEKERQQDEDNCRILAAKLPGSRILTDGPAAEDLIEAGIETVMELNKNGNRYILLDNRLIVDFDGNIVGDVKDLEGFADLSPAIQKELAEARITETVNYDYDGDHEEEDDDEELDYYEDYDDDYGSDLDDCGHRPWDFEPNVVDCIFAHYFC